MTVVALRYFCEISPQISLVCFSSPIAFSVPPTSKLSRRLPVPHGIVFSCSGEAAVLPACPLRSSARSLARRSLLCCTNSNICFGFESLTNVYFAHVFLSVRLPMCIRCSQRHRLRSACDLAAAAAAARAKLDTPTDPPAARLTGRPTCFVQL